MMSHWAGDSYDNVAKKNSALLGQISQKRAQPEIILELDFKSPLRRPLIPLAPQTSTSPIDGV